MFLCQNKKTLGCENRRATGAWRGEGAAIDHGMSAMSEPEQGLHCQLPGSWFCRAPGCYYCCCRQQQQAVQRGLAVRFSPTLAGPSTRARRLLVEARAETTLQQQKAV